MNTQQFRNTPQAGTRAISEGEFRTMPDDDQDEYLANTAQAGMSPELRTNYGNQRPREPICGWCEVGTVRFTGEWEFAPYVCVPTRWEWNNGHTVLGYCGLNYKNLADASAEVTRHIW